MKFPTECADCAECGEPLIRFPEGPWSHFLDARDDQDHEPEPDVGALTEREMEAQLEMWRKDIPTHSAVQINDIRNVNVKGKRL